MTNRDLGTVAWIVTFFFCGAMAIVAFVFGGHVLASLNGLIAALAFYKAVNAIRRI